VHSLDVYVRPSSIAELQAILCDHQPAIAFLKTGALEYWNLDSLPTAVLIDKGT
jgi:hypothetical protein